MSPSIRNRWLDDDLIIVLGIYHSLKTKRGNRRRPVKVWVNQYLRERRTKGRFFRDFQDMRANRKIFKENFHMSVSKFDILLKLVQGRLTPKKKARLSDSISAVEKLCITLEFLASGTLQRHIWCLYRVSKQRIGSIIDQTCDAIYHTLSKEYKFNMNEKNWTEVANSYNAKWNFPNCVGALDGKHVAIKAPKNAASLFYCYKGFHSIVLMALADADYRFLYFDIGAYGSEGDSTVFRSSDLGKGLVNGTLNVPGPRLVYGKPLPFFFVGDDAFPLHTNLMKPFTPPRGGLLWSRSKSYSISLMMLKNH